MELCVLCLPIISLMSSPQEGGDGRDEARPPEEAKTKKRERESKNWRIEDRTGEGRQRPAWGLSPLSPSVAFFPTPLSLIGLKL